MFQMYPFFVVLVVNFIRVLYEIFFCIKNKKMRFFMRFLMDPLIDASAVGLCVTVPH